MDLDEFAQGYAARSGVTVEMLRQMGRAPATCNCGDAICPGWQMAHVNILEEMERDGFMLPRDRATLAEIRAREEKQNG